MMYIFVALAILIFYTALKVIRSSNPKGFAKGIAKTQLRTFYAMRSKYPGIKKSELYAATLHLRPRITDAEVLDIINMAKQSRERDGEALNFQEVVLWLVMREYQKRTGTDFSSVMIIYHDLRNTINSVIPSSL